MTTPPARTTPPPPAGPAFGTPEWDRCPCGRWATMHFPLAGGLRRCDRCSVAEGRMKGPDR